MTKWLLFFVCSFFTITSFGANDSIRKDNNHGISIGFEFAPVSYLKWSFPEYKNVESSQSNSEEKKDNTKKYILIPKCGLHLSYSVNKTIKIETGIYYSMEEVDGIIFTDTINHTIVRKNIGSPINQFVQLPISFNFRMPDNIKKRSYTNFSLGFNFDFIYYEKNYYGTITVTDSLSGKSIYHSVLYNKSRSNKYSFNKITPFIFIGREHYNKNKNFSFYYGSMFTFKSIYQRHNTAEFFKNYKITPLIIGFAYHF